jgi:AMMECR1 domain-containing protein
MAQKLSPTAKRDKAARDLAFAKTPARRAKKAHAQRERNANPSVAKNKDYDHKRQAFVSVKSNRGNEGDGTKRESGNNYKTN